MVHRDQADYNNEVRNIADKLNVCDNGVLVKLKYNEWWRCMESVLLNCWRLGKVYNGNLFTVGIVDVNVSIVICASIVVCASILVCARLHVINMVVFIFLNVFESIKMRLCLSSSFFIFIKCMNGVITKLRMSPSHVLYSVDIQIYTSFNVVMMRLILSSLY